MSAPRINNCAFIRMFVKKLFMHKPCDPWFYCCSHFLRNLFCVLVRNYIRKKREEI
jgi:hypothetical protein